MRGQICPLKLKFLLSQITEPRRLIRRTVHHSYAKAIS